MYTFHAQVWSGVGICFTDHMFLCYNMKRTGGDPTSLLFDNRDTSTSCPETFGLSFQAHTCQLQHEKDPMQRQPVDIQKKSFEDILACLEVSFKKLNKSKVQSIIRIYTYRIQKYSNIK